MATQAGSEASDYHSIFRGMPCACVVTDNDGIVRSANAAAHELVGAKILVDRPLVSRIATPDRASVDRLSNYCLEGEGSDPLVVSLETTGSRVPPRVELHVACVEEQRLVWLLRDVTSEEANHARLRDAIATERHAAQQLRRLDDTRRAFIRAVSHDLQAPLAGIAGLADLILSQHRMADADRRPMLQQIAISADLVLTKLRGLLDLERLERGEFQLQHQQVDVGELVAETAEQIELGGRRLVIDGGELEARIDPVVLERILYNLLTNAAVHTPPGATVWVRYRREPDGLIFAVEDNGPGIPAALRRKVFDLFERHNDAGQPGGLGVGLSLVRQFAEVHGGHVRVQKRSAGSGASFIVLLAEARDET